MGDFADTLAQVRQLHARYCDAVVRKDAAAFGDCFTEDCEWRISGRLLEGRTGSIHRIEQTFREARCIYIEFATPMLDIGPGGEVSARTYMNERCIWNDGRTNIVIGRYFERYAHHGDGLRFSWRLWQGLYTGPADLSGKCYDAANYGPPPGMPAADEIPPPMT
jgi:hypothetical protein